MTRDRFKEQLDVPGNWGELVIDFGRRLQKKIRGGAGLEEASQRFHSTSAYCHLAITFAGTSDLIKLRAMVEDWSLDRIVEELGQPQPVPLWR